MKKISERMSYMKFEDALKNVDEIIARLSSGELPLEDAIELYKTGSEQLAACQRMIDTAQSAMMPAAKAEDIAE